MVTIGSWGFDLNGDIPILKKNGISMGVVATSQKYVTKDENNIGSNNITFTYYEPGKPFLKYLIVDLKEQTITYGG